NQNHNELQIIQFTCVNETDSSSFTKIRVFDSLFFFQDVEDTSPNRCAASFKVLVVSPQFEGKPLLQRHRMVNNCLAEELKEIHAFEQKTLTPEQWEKQKAQ
uniref:BolA-like protein 2 n=2 Tax=Cypriniformes TaxID=7952 RepID=A0A8C2DIU8_CYPCA